MNLKLLFLADANLGGPSAGVGAWLVLALGLAGVLIAAEWKVAVKAGHPGWGVLIPVYNVYLLTRMVGRPGWWVLLMFIPVVNVVTVLILLVDLARSFGKDIGFALGLILLHPLFVTLLGFGSAQYVGPAAGDAVVASPANA